MKNTPDLGPAPTRPGSGAAPGLPDRSIDVLRALAESPVTLTVTEVVERIGGHPNAARGHLSALVDAGLAATESIPPQGRGRPATAYGPTDAGRRRVGRERPPTTPREHVVWTLDRLGFGPIERDATLVQLTTCPLLEQARATPDIVCQVHRDLIADTLRRHGASDDGVALTPFSDPGWCRLLLPPD